ncbi:MAG TPA: TetR/AcrR family transcriptional regulator [Sphingomonas sp.]|nr:TetR/AcrR family transcriptional regulator [Sphingomonas sp.]
MRTSPPSSRRAYHHGDLRNRLLEAARRQIELAGPESISLRELARSLGVSHNAPSRHFSSREALLAALAEIGFGELKSAMAGEREGPPDQLVARLGRTYVRFGMRNHALYRVMFDSGIERSRHPSLAAEAKSAFQLLLAAVGGTHPASHIRAHAAWALVHGLVELLSPMNDGGAGSDLADLVVEEAVSVFQSGIGARPYV